MYKLVLLLLFVYASADVSQLTGYLPPENEITIGNNKAEKTEENSNLDNQVNESSNYLPPVDENKAKDNYVLTQYDTSESNTLPEPKQAAETITELTTTTFLPCYNVLPNGYPCIGANQFIQGPNFGANPNFNPGPYFLPGGNFIPGLQTPGQGFLPPQNAFARPGNGFPGQNFINPNSFIPGQNFGGGSNISPGSNIFSGQQGYFPPGPNFPPVIYPENNFMSSQNFESSSGFENGQNFLTGAPNTFPTPSFFPGQRRPSNGVTVSNFGRPGSFTDKTENQESNLPTIKSSGDTKYADDGGYLYETPKKFFYY